MSQFRPSGTNKRTFRFSRPLHSDELQHRAVVAKRHLRENGKEINPVTPIASIKFGFVAQEWLRQLERNVRIDIGRINRGRALYHCGGIVDLVVRGSEINASAVGYRLYKTRVRFRPRPALVKRFIATLKAARSTGEYDKALHNATGTELLAERLKRGRVHAGLSQDDSTPPKSERLHYKSTVYAEVIQRFPKLFFYQPRNYTLHCDCPDRAHNSPVCKHLIATMYGFASLFDSKEDLFWQFYGVPMDELGSAQTQDASQAITTLFSEPPSDPKRSLGDQSLEKLFGIRLVNTSFDN